MIKITTPINEKSTKCVHVVLREARTDLVVAPTSLKWTLITTSGEIVNDREQIPVAQEKLGAALDHGNVATIIVLSGNDLGCYESETGALVTRYLVVEGTYDSSCGDDGLPITEYVEFTITNIPYLKLAEPTPQSEMNAITLLERSVDPVDPSEGETKIWMSDGTETGDDGDILAKITVGGVTNPLSIKVYKVTGVNPIISSATWYNYNGSTAWPGGDGALGDLAATPEDTVGAGATGWISLDVSGMVTDWFATPNSNYGLALVADTGASGSYRYFKSSESSDDGYRPYFYVESTTAFPTCSENWEYCFTQSECETSNWYWYNNQCNETDQLSPPEIKSIQTYGVSLKLLPVN